MDIFATVLVGFVAFLHLYFLFLEMFMWTKPRTIKVFGMTKDLAEQTKAMAANQGLYNGFLAAGLLWGLFHNNLAIGFQIQVFFLLCVIVAGIYGGLTVKKTIIFVQAVPALIALIALFLT